MDTPVASNICDGILLQGVPPAWAPVASGATGVAPLHKNGVGVAAYGFVRSPKPSALIAPLNVPGRARPSGSAVKSPFNIDGVGTIPTKGMPWRCRLP